MGPSGLFGACEKTSNHGNHVIGNPPASEASSVVSRTLQGPRSQFRYVVIRMVRYINCDELASLMRSDKVAKKDYIVVDVRDDDRVGGHIKNSLNIPSGDFLMNVDRLVKDTKDVPLIVFHCALSQVRGPKAARVYEETRQNILEGSDIEHEVVILRDGFTLFQTKFRNDADLVENWDKDVWEPEWEIQELNGWTSVNRP